MAWEPSHDRHSSRSDADSDPADWAKDFAFFTSPDLLSPPFTAKTSQTFLLQSPGPSVGSSSTFVSPRDTDNWTPVAPGPNVHHDRTQTDQVDDNDSVNKGLGLTLTSASLPPNQPRRSRISWLRKLYMGKWSMAFCFILGVCLAVSHHLYFRSLNGKEATDQIKTYRIGSVLSIAAKSSLVIATILAYRQRAWMVVRDKAHSVREVDTLFGAAENLMEFLSFTMMKNDLPCLILAFFIWASPLIIVFSADTLSVSLKTTHEHTTCPSIRTLNFSHEATNDWDKPQVPENQTRNVLSLSTWNATLAYSERYENNSNYFDYWTSSSSQFQVVASQSLWGQHALVNESSVEDICGAGWNCSATIEFTAPGYDCTELAHGQHDSIDELDGQSPPFNMSVLAPQGDYSYIAAATRGAYPPQVMEYIDPGGIITWPDPPFPDNLGAFRTDPIIWVGYTIVDDVVQKPPNSSVAAWNDTFTPVIFGCIHKRTKYKVQLNWTAPGLQTYKVKERHHMGKFINTRYVSNETEDGTLDVTTAEPESNYVLPKDVEHYRETAAYYSMGARLREMINGTATIPGNIVTGQAINTRLLDPHWSLPVKNLSATIQSLYDDLIISMLANPQFLIVSWAKSPNVSTGVAVGSAATDYDCDRQRTISAWDYHDETLWAVYIIAIVSAFIGVILGFVAAGRDDRGELREMIYSEIVAATRGRDLDGVRWDQNMDKKNVKVLYQKPPGDNPGRFVLRAVDEPERRGFIRRRLGGGMN